MSFYSAVLLRQRWPTYVMAFFRFSRLNSVCSISRYFRFKSCLEARLRQHSLSHVFHFRGVIEATVAFFSVFFRFLGVIEATVAYFGVFQFRGVFEATVSCWRFVISWRL